MNINIMDKVYNKRYIVIPVDNMKLYHMALKRLVELGYHDTKRVWNPSYTYLRISEKVNSSIEVMHNFNVTLIRQAGSAKYKIVSFVDLFSGNIKKFDKTSLKHGIRNFI